MLANVTKSSSSIKHSDGIVDIGKKQTAEENLIWRSVRELNGGEFGGAFGRRSSDCQQFELQSGFEISRTDLWRVHSERSIFEVLEGYKSFRFTAINSSS